MFLCSSLKLQRRSHRLRSGVCTISAFLLCSLASNAQLPDPEVSTEYLAQIYEVDGFSTRWIAQPVNDLTKGYALQFFKGDTVAELPGAGTSLVVVALIGTEVHIRVFDDTGTLVVDKPESELQPGPALAEIKPYLELETLPVVAEMPEEEVRSILGKVTSTADYPPPHEYPITDRIENPAYNDVANLSYSSSNEFNIASKAGYGSGLGILTESELPPIDSFDGPWQIRTSSLVTSRTIRHFTATSDDAAEFAADLLLIVDGKMGYTPRAGTPFAFERLLDSRIDLVVRVHRSDGSVETVWEAGAVIGQSEDVAVPFNAYGDWDANDWTVSGSGREATLNLFEHISSKFTVQNGETFAVEFELKAQTRNYEYPNSTAYVDMLNTGGLRIFTASEHHGDYINSGPISLDEDIVIPSDFKSGMALSSFELRDLPGAYRDERIVIRPPAIFPTVGNGVQEIFDFDYERIKVLARDIATFFPNAPGGQLGAELRTDYYDKIEFEENGADAFLLFASPQIFSRYVPFFSGTPPESIDVDLQYLLDGVVEFKARSNEILQRLLSSNEPLIIGNITVDIKVATRESSPGLPISSGIDDLTLKLLIEKGEADPEHFSEIVDSENRTVGYRWEIIENSAEMPIASSLEDIIVLGEDDYLEVFFKLSLRLDVNPASAPDIDYIHLDFYNTFAPEISTDTPGVTFILADSEIDRTDVNLLQVERADSDSVVLSWPSEGVGDLQTNDNLEEGTWTSVDLPAQDNGVLKTLIIPVGEERQFYRLDPNVPSETAPEEEVVPEAE